MAFGDFFAAKDFGDLTTDDTDVSKDDDDVDDGFDVRCDGVCFMMMMILLLSGAMAEDLFTCQDTELTLPSSAVEVRGTCSIRTTVTGDVEVKRNVTVPKSMLVIILVPIDFETTGTRS